MDDRCSFCKSKRKDSIIYECGTLENDAYPRTYSCALNAFTIKATKIYIIKRECNCIEKLILVEGDAMFKARETFCPKHGYYTSCWRCNDNSTTELCLKCSKEITNG